MKLEQYTKIISQIREKITDVETLKLLDEIHEDYKTEIPRLEGEVAQATEQIEKVTKERNEYAVINSKYWQQLNAQMLQTENETSDETLNEEEPKKLSYDDLVDSMLEK